jgi:flagellar assembly protein FliH
LTEVSELTGPLLARAYDYADVRARVEPQEFRPAFELRAASGVADRVVEGARAEARASGFASGWAQGVHEAREQMAEQVRRSHERQAALDAERAAGLTLAFTALDQAVAQVERTALPSIESLEDVIVDLAMKIAEAVVGHELLASKTLGRDALARVLRLAPDGEGVTVELSPADHAVLIGSPELDELTHQRRVTLLASPALSDGDAIARSGATRIDSRIADGLERIKDVLSR